MNRVSTIREANKFQLIPLHDMKGQEDLWASYLAMREIQEDTHGISGDPDAIQNEFEAVELECMSSLRTEFFNSVALGFEDKTDFRYALINTQNNTVVGETVIYPPSDNDLAWSNSMIHPEMRGLGIGNIMLARVLEESQNLFTEEENQVMQATIRASNEGSWRRFQKLANAGLATYDGEISGKHSNRKSYKYTVPLNDNGEPVNFTAALVKKAKDPEVTNAMDELA